MNPITEWPIVADDSVCDCSHRAYEHTDRGKQDAGLCLNPACGCPEFVESEGDVYHLVGPQDMA